MTHTFSHPLALSCCIQQIIMYVCIPCAGLPHPAATAGPDRRCCFVRVRQLMPAVVGTLPAPVVQSWKTSPSPRDRPHPRCPEQGRGSVLLQLNIYRNITTVFFCLVPLPFTCCRPGFYRELLDPVAVRFKTREFHPAAAE